MNAGVIASRYAKALLTFVTETGAGEKVYSQAGFIVQMLESVPQLRDVVLKHDEVALVRKVELLTTALDEPLADELVRFMNLVAENRRMEFFQRMLWAFISQYRHARNIKVGSLVTAVPEDGLRERLESIFHDMTSCEVHFETSVDPELIGGFVFELDGRRLDASVRSQLERIRRSLIDEGSRIV